MSDIFNYDDLAPQDFHFQYRGNNYVLKEPSEDAVLAFRQWQLRDAKVVDGKMSTNIERVYESQSLLVSKSLFKRVEKNGETVDQLVSSADVRAIPARIVKDLFDRAKSMGEVNEEDTEDGIERQIKALQDRLAKLRESRDAAKNALSGGAVTSSSPRA